MRAYLQIGPKGRIYIDEGCGPRAIPVSEVLKDWGTRAMCELYRGKIVHIMSETEEDRMMDRPGS